MKKKKYKENCDEVVEEKDEIRNKQKKKMSEEYSTHEQTDLNN